MYFVYLLSYNGIPFYVGMTNDLVKRYMKHYSVRDCNAYDCIRRIMHDHGEYVDMLPISYCDKVKAIGIERETIKLLCSHNIKLGNRIHNEYGNRIPEDIIKAKNPRFPLKLKKKLTELQKHYILVYAQR